jgi:hypothetical protein
MGRVKTTERNPLLFSESSAERPETKNTLTNMVTKVP